MIARGGPKAVDPSLSHQLDRTLRFLHYCDGECNHKGTLCFGVVALVSTEQLTANVIRSYYLVVDYHSPGRTESRRSQL